MKSGHFKVIHYFHFRSFFLVACSDKEESKEKDEKSNKILEDKSFIIGR